jgi:hypothetical protein
MWRDPVLRGGFTSSHLDPLGGMTVLVHCLLFAAASALAPAPEGPPIVRSARSGAWSDPGTWEGGRAPGAGARVQVREGHEVRYDVDSDVPIRSIHVAGTLEFARDRDTRLEVGLIKVQPGDDAGEDGFDCDAHVPALDPKRPRPALLVGLPNEPIPAGKTAKIRLRYVEGLDEKTCPAIVCCGGRMELHGAPMDRTWVKLGRTASAKEDTVLLAEPVPGWKPGDRVILTGTTRHRLYTSAGNRPHPFGYADTYKDSVRDLPSTEERTIVAIRSSRSDRAPSIVLDEPLGLDHRAVDDYRGEVANLSRNVIVESADPGGVRGHVMYHRGSAGSVHYAELRHLGKEGVLGKYSLHFHLAGDTMRGSSVIGASIWDSKNRWITIHGTNYLVVRDCVGYRSVGHGFFLEDGTEAYNVLDRNLAVQAFLGRPLLEQVLPFDHNDGAGFWWANCLNTFTRNVAAECDQYGFRFEARKTDKFDPVLPVLRPDGRREPVDIRTLPFVRFEDNEAHCQRRFAMNLGGIKGFARADDKIEDVKSGDVQGVGPDARHPFIIRDMKVWNTHWSFHAGSPSVLIQRMKLFDCEFGFFHSYTRLHRYEDLEVRGVKKVIYFPWGGIQGADAAYDEQLEPVDDLPPTTVVTGVARRAGGTLTVKGTTADDGPVAKVLVNGREARALRDDFAEWEIDLAPASSGGLEVRAHAEDAAGNVEQRPHILRVDPPAGKDAASRSAE